MKYVRIVNQTRQTTIVEQAEMADTMWSRFMGLMGRPGLEPNTGLVIMPNNSIHMFFMSFAIDVLHVAADGRVLKILHSIKPWRIGPIVFKSKYTVELPAGTAKRTGTVEGDQIELVPTQ